MAPSKQALRPITDLYKDFLKVEKQQQKFATQKAKFVKELISEQQKLDKSLVGNAASEQNKKIELLNKKISEEAVKSAEIENKKNELQNQIRTAKEKLEQHIFAAKKSTNKDLISKAQGAQKELDSYNQLLAKTDKKQQEEERKKRELAEKVKLEEQKRQEEATRKAEEKEKKRQEAVRKDEDKKALNAKKAKEKIKSDYVKERDNLFGSAQNICSKTKQITPAVKEILEIDWTKKASEQKLQIANAAATAIFTGLDNAFSIGKIVTSAKYYVKEAKKVDIDDKAKTADSFFIKLLSDKETEKVLKNTLPQINQVAEEIAPILVSKTLDYLEKTGKKYEQKEQEVREFAERKTAVMAQIAENADKALPKELQQKLEAINKEQEAISKANVSEKQSSIRKSLGKTISALKKRGFDDGHINETFVPIMSSIIHNASQKPEEVTGAVKALVDLGLATNSQEQAKAVTELVLSELITDTLKDKAVQNLATTQTGFVTATIQEIVKNNNTLQDRAKKIGITDNSIRNLTEMATGVATIGLKFGGKLLDGLSEERAEVQKVIETTINAGKNIAQIIDENTENKAQHVATIAKELKVVADQALELANRESVQGVIKELGADIAKDKELPNIVKQGVKTIVEIAAPNVAKLGNFNTVVDFAVDLGVNVTVAGLEGANEVNSLVRNTVIPVATDIAVTVLKNADKINGLAQQVKEINERRKTNPKDNVVDKATGVINNGLEVASNVMNLLNDKAIKESLTSNLSKFGQDLKSAKHVKNLVTTVAKNILPASEIISDRDVANRVIADTAILAEKTVAAVLSEEQNITAIFDAATSGVVVAKSLLSNEKQPQATAASISKVLESATILLTDESIANVISQEAPNYIATHGKTFIEAVASQIAKPKKVAPAEEVPADALAEQSQVELMDPPVVQKEPLEVSKELPKKTPSSKEKAIEVVSNVASNVRDVLQILQTEEGKKSKEAIVSNLAKLGDQIVDQGYVRKIVPQIFNSLMPRAKQDSPVIQEKPADQENHQKPSSLGQQKDPMAPEKIKITPQDIIQTAKSIRGTENIEQFVQDSSVLTEKIVSIALKQSNSAINIASSLLVLGENIATNNKEKDSVNNTKLEERNVKIQASKPAMGDIPSVRENIDMLAQNILTIAKDPELKNLITKDLPQYIQENQNAILAITDQVTSQYEEQIEAVGLSKEVITRTVNLSVKLLTDKNIAPIYELVGNVINNSGMSNDGQNDIALLIENIYDAAINKDNKEIQAESVQKAINKIGDIIFSANTYEDVRKVVTQNIPRLLQENQKEIAGLAEEFLENTEIGQKISSRISIDVERGLKVAEKKSDTLLSLLNNYHNKNYLGAVKNVIDLATSPKVVKFLASTAARTIHMKVKGSHAERVDKRRPSLDQRGR